MGVRYECTRCGNCCRWQGIVRLTADEIDAIADFLGLTPEAFADAYAELTPDRRCLTLVDGPEGYCIMLTQEGLCRIHPVKPAQCRDFPNAWRIADLEKHCKARRLDP